MDILSQNIDFLEQHDVFFHDSAVFLFMDILIFLEHLSKIVHIIFQVLALICVFSVKISVTLFILDLFLNILFVKSNCSLLQFLEVSNVMKTFEDIILELLFEPLLFIELFSQVCNFIVQTLLTHSQIVNDQSQVLIHSIEVLQLLSHLVCLFVQFLDFDFSGSDITLELLDFVIKNEFELFKFLCLLFQIVNTLVLILNGGLTLLDFSLLRVNLLSE